MIRTLCRSTPVLLGRHIPQSFPWDLAASLEINPLPGSAALLFRALGCISIDLCLIQPPTGEALGIVPICSLGRANYSLGLKLQVQAPGHTALKGWLGAGWQHWGCVCC